MLRGGVADKWGNGYEARWTLLEALRVLQGLSGEIRLEPFDEDAVGLEFRVTTNGRSIWHQCKRRGSGSWTIKALISEGVVAAFGRKLANASTKCVFVSGDPARDLAVLADKARLAGDAGAFAAMLSKDDRVALTELRTAWGIGVDAAWGRLKRCRVETVSDRTLDDLLEQLCGLFFTAPAGTAANVLLGYLDSQLTRTVTTEGFRAAIDGLDLGWRARLDSTVGDRVKAATDSYLGSLMEPIPGARTSPDLARPGRLSVSEGTSLVMVTGGAGGGKSLALARAVALARRKKTPVLAFRIDRHLEARSVEDLGESLLGRRENPVGVFGNRFGTEPCLLVVDQVDAVSEASGRSSVARDLLLRLLGDAALYPGLRVIVACRAYDLKNDGVLARLAAQENAAQVELAALDWDKGVRPVLRRLGLGERDFSDRERQILGSPINLKLFATLAAAGEAPKGDLSGPALFDALLEMRARQLAGGGLGWTPQAPLAAMAAWMSDHQTLAAPAVVLAPFEFALERLSSAGLLTAGAGRVQFAHESFFDHVFSAEFVRRSEKLLDLLRRDEQRLFRRTQVRQILARLRALGPPRRYLGELKSVMEAADVRFLIKDAVGAWLASLDDPSTAELDLVEPWFAEGHPLAAVAHAILVGRGWRDLLRKRGALARWLTQPGRHKAAAVWSLQRSAVDHPEEVAATLRAWWGGQADRRAELLSWFDTLYPEGPIGGLEGLYAEAVEDLPDAEVKRRVDENFDLDQWAHKDAALAARMTGVWLRRWFRAFPEEQPFGQSLGDDDHHGLGELLTRAPRELAAVLLPALGEALRRDVRALAEGRIDYPELRTPFLHDDHIVGLAARTIDALAPKHPRLVAGLLNQLPVGSDVTLWLRLRAIAANGAAFAGRLSGLLARRAIFHLGYEAPAGAFADAARSAMPHLPAADRARVEQAVLSYRPEAVRAAEWLRDPLDPLDGVGDEEAARRIRTDALELLQGAGIAQHAILRRIGGDQLSAAARRRLTELDRKFPGPPAEEPRGARGGFVRSPITPEQAALMSDAQWLSAIRKYDGTERRIFRRDDVIGGAEQLASVLAEQTKTAPVRFARLLDPLPADANPAYPAAIFDGLFEAPSEPALAVAAWKALARWPTAQRPQALCWAVQRIPGMARDAELRASLLELAEHGTAADNLVRSTKPNPPSKPTIAKLLGGGDLEGSGRNGVRGAAYEALAAALWDDAGLLVPITELLDRRVEAEPLTSVRMAMLGAVNAVLGREPDRGLSLLRRVAARDLRALMGRHGRHILNWATYNRTDEVEGIIEALAGSPDEDLRALGYAHQAALALQDPAREPGVTAAFPGDELRRRTAAWIATTHVGRDRVGERAAAWLPAFYADPADAVRDEAAKTPWDTILDEAPFADTLAATFLDSPAFDGTSGPLIRALSKRVETHVELAHRAVKRALKRLAEAKDGRTPGLTELHLGPMLMALYRRFEDDPVREGEILDLFDLYLAGDRYRIRQEISAYERH